MSARWGGQSIHLQCIKIEMQSMALSHDGHWLSDEILWGGQARHACPDGLVNC